MIDCITEATTRFNIRVDSIMDVFLHAVRLNLKIKEYCNKHQIDMECREILVIKFKNSDDELRVRLACL